jgi:hypothetical protein
VFERDIDRLTPLAAPSDADVQHWVRLAEAHDPDHDVCGTGTGCSDRLYAVTQLGSHNALHLIERTHNAHA